MQDFASKSVLVVDNSAAMRRLLRTALRGFGIGEIAEAADAEAAAIRIVKHVFDCIVLDFFLGAQDGADFARGLRRMNDNPNRRAPILLVTALPGHEKLLKAREAGIDATLAKPVSTEDLYVQLRALIAAPRPFIEAGGYAGPCRRVSRAELDQALVASRA